MGLLYTCHSWRIVSVPVQDMEPSEIGSILRHPAMGKTVQECVNSFPSLYLDAQLQPITRCHHALSNTGMVLYRKTCVLASCQSWVVHCLPDV